MRAGRLLSLLMLLQLRGRVSATALARELEVSVRTIYRDAEALGAAGVPIYAEPGRNGGLVLSDGYRTRLTGLTRGEAESLAFAGLLEAAKDLGLGADAAAAQLKVLASLPGDSGASARRIAERFHLDPLPWYHRAETLDCLPTLANAVWRERKIRIEYESWEGVVRRELAPLGLVLKGGLWYLVAASRGRPRTYRVSNIGALEVLERGFERPEGFELARFWPASCAEFEARLMRETATVRLSPEGRSILRATHPAAAERAEASQRPSKVPGWIEAEIPIESPEYSARQLLRLGAEVEVLAPAELRAAILREAERVVGVYGKRRGRVKSH